jgi:formate dehydrogenase subunit delta
MNNDHLIRMANQIGVFFESMPDRPEALLDLAQHIKKFWDPRMRRAFLALLDGDDSSSQISDIVRQAAQTHRALLA